LRQIAAFSGHIFRSESKIGVGNAEQQLPLSIFIINSLESIFFKEGEMVAIRLSAVVDDDHQLTVKVPEDIPVGPVELLIQVPEPGKSLLINPAREAAKAKLTAAGLLSTAHNPPPGMRIPTREEVLAAGVLLPGARSLEELINEDRDEA
jgi:hypothetical protein